MKKMTQTPLRSKQEILRKQSKQKDYKLLHGKYPLLSKNAHVD